MLVKYILPAFALAENIDRTDLTAYEIAVAIQNAEPMFKSKSSLASALGLNRTALYKYLSFFKLPAFVVDDLEIRPDIIGRDAADAIASLLAGAGDVAVRSLENIWPRVRSGDLDQGKIVSTIEAALKHKTAIRTDRDIKKLFVGRISKAIVSGKSQENLMRNLGFNGECVHSGGVGIFHKSKVIRKERKFGGKFLFVGRLSAEKNIHFLSHTIRTLAGCLKSLAPQGFWRIWLKINNAHD